MFVFDSSVLTTIACCILPALSVGSSVLAWLVLRNGSDADDDMYGNSQYYL